MKVVFKYLILLAIMLLSQRVVGGENSEMQGITAAHNIIRQKVGVPVLVWSDDLALYAQKWADQLALKKGCRMLHRSAAKENSQQYGENLYWASAKRWSDGTLAVQKVTPEIVVLSWESEQKDYAYASNSCRNGKVCGHYTQIVWRQSQLIGCGKAVCEDKSQVWVCNYDPPGNIVGQRPY